MSSYLVKMSIEFLIHVSFVSLLVVLEAERLLSLVLLATPYSLMYNQTTKCFSVIYFIFADFLLIFKSTIVLQ